MLLYGMHSWSNLWDASRDLTYIIYSGLQYVNQVDLIKVTLLSFCGYLILTLPLLNINEEAERVCTGKKTGSW